MSISITENELRLQCLQKAIDLGFQTGERKLESIIQNAAEFADFVIEKPKVS